MKQLRYILCFSVCLVLLILCGCQNASEDQAPQSPPATETTAERLIREIDGAYKEAQKLPESSTTVGTVKLANTYKEKWIQVADEYYNKLMQYDGVITPAEHYATSEDLHRYIADMKTAWEQYNQAQCENYLKVLKARYQGGTIVGPLIAQYGYDLQMEWALELVYICQMFCIS